MSVSNALLFRGNNTIPFTGQLFLDTIVANLGTILGNSTTLSGGDFNMLIKDGQSSIGGQQIPWVDAVLAHSPLLAAVPLTQLLQSALGTVIGLGSRSLPEEMSQGVERLLKSDKIDLEHAKGQVGSQAQDMSISPTRGTQEADHLLARRAEPDVLQAAILYQTLRERRTRREGVQ